MKIVVFQFKFHWNMFQGSPIHNNSALVQIMAWFQTGNKPLSEPIQWQIYVPLGLTELNEKKNAKGKLTCHILHVSIEV